MCVYIHIGLSGPPKKKKELVAEQVKTISNGYTWYLRMYSV